ncbi:MAG: GerMN domain-containing protein [Acidobacteria bacterium]|nr:GerMN domain-containing protein [Acidobacteriota bacterium]
MTLRALALGAVVVSLLAACSRKGPVQATSSPAPPPPTAMTTKPVQLFYEDESLLLAPRIERVALPESDGAAIRPLLAALLAPAPPATEPRPIPEGVEIRATFLLPDGTAIVDLGGPLLTAGWKTGSQAELMLAYSIVQTLTSNLPSVRQVQLLINGQPAETLAGHVSIERPLQPNPRIVRPQAARNQ